MKGQTPKAVPTDRLDSSGYSQGRKDARRSSGYHRSLVPTTHRRRHHSHGRLSAPRISWREMPPRRATILLPRPPLGGLVVLLGHVRLLDGDTAAGAVAGAASFGVAWATAAGAGAGSSSSTTSRRRRGRRFRGFLLLRLRSPPPRPWPPPRPSSPGSGGGLEGGVRGGPP